MVNTELSLSVIIPFFNAMEYFPCTYESLEKSLRKANVKYEIVIVDDGSNKENKEFLIEFKKKHSKVFICELEINSGPSAAKNRGISGSKGDFICFFDADDICSENKFSDQLAFLLKNNLNNVGMVFSDWELQSNQNIAKLSPFCDADGIISDRSYIISRLLYSQNFIATGSQIFTRNAVLKVGGFDESRKLIEDVHFMLRIAANNFCFLKCKCSDFNFRYLKRSSGASSGKSYQFPRACLDNTRYALHVIDKIDGPGYSELRGIIISNLLGCLSCVDFFGFYKNSYLIFQLCKKKYESKWLLYFDQIYTFVYLLISFFRFLFGCLFRFLKNKYFEFCKS